MDPIFGTIERWHAHLRGELEGGLSAVLADDVVFYSPVVHTPQRGKQITTLYLTGAMQILGGIPVAGVKADYGDSFRYTKTIAAGHHAALEFETRLAGDTEVGHDIDVNGIDIITCDDDGHIVEFRVLVRPLQAINLVHRRMQAALETFAGG